MRRMRYHVIRRYKTAAELGLTEKALREQVIISMEIAEELRSEGH